MAKDKKEKESFFNEHKTELLIGSVVIVLTIGTGTIGYRFLQKNKLKKENIENALREVKPIITCSKCMEPFEKFRDEELAEALREAAEKSSGNKTYGIKQLTKELNYQFPERNCIKALKANGLLSEDGAIAEVAKGAIEYKETKWGGEPYIKFTERIALTLDNYFFRKKMLKNEIIY